MRVSVCGWLVPLTGTGLRLHKERMRERRKAHDRVAAIQSVCVLRSQSKSQSQSQARWCYGMVRCDAISMRNCTFPCHHLLSASRQAPSRPGQVPRYIGTKTSLATCLLTNPVYRPLSPLCFCIHPIHPLSRPTTHHPAEPSSRTSNSRNTSIDVGRGPMVYLSQTSDGTVSYVRSDSNPNQYHLVNNSVSPTDLSPEGSDTISLSNVPSRR